MESSNLVDNVEVDNKFGGWVDVEVWRDGRYGPVRTKHVRSHNLVPLCGKKWIWELASGHKTKHFQYMRIGSSSLAATSDQTNVQTPIAGSRNTVDSKTLGTGRTFVYVNSYPSSASGTTTGGILSFAAAKEVCILCQLTTPGGATALMRCVFTAVAKTKADKVKITYSIRVT